MLILAYEVFKFHFVWNFSLVCPQVVHFSIFHRTYILTFPPPFWQVINFDMPQSPAGYVHRIGRTGRAYNTGASVSLVSLHVIDLSLNQGKAKMNTS